MNNRKKLATIITIGIIIGVPIFIWLVTFYKIVAAIVLAIGIPTAVWLMVYESLDNYRD